MENNTKFKLMVLLIFLLIEFVLHLSLAFCLMELSIELVDINHSIPLDDNLFISCIVDNYLTNTR